MIYLKTIFSASNEIKYLKQNLQESFSHIDKFIICEFNRTHIGSKREFIFEKYLNQFTQEEKKKIIYIKGDIASSTQFSRTNSHVIHEINERLIRGYFASQINLKFTDIVFSLDADEIIFESQYKKIISHLRWWRPAIKLTLYQFFYKINYLWENNKFIAPTVCFAYYYKWRYPAHWRYSGWLYREYVGCHFSWCLTIEEMLNKLNHYSHHQDYGHLADRKLLENAVKNKKYPFDPKVDFRIKVLDVNKDKKYYPKTIYSQINNFKYLII